MRKFLYRKASSNALCVGYPVASNLTISSTVFEVVNVILLVIMENHTQIK